MMNGMRQAAAGNFGDSETVYPESMATEMEKRPIRLRATGLAPRIISHRQKPWNSSTPNPPVRRRNTAIQATQNTPRHHAPQPCARKSQLALIPERISHLPPIGSHMRLGRCRCD